MTRQSTVGASPTLRRFAVAGLLMLAAVTAPISVARASGTIASAVLGQSNFTGSTANSPTGASLNLNSYYYYYYYYYYSGANALAIDSSSSPPHLWVADPGNSRVLGFRNAAALANGQAADIVVGQPNFKSTTCNSSIVYAANLCEPGGVAVDSSGNLYVSDTGNNRVLIFADPFTTNTNTGQTAGFAAFMVLGQGEDFFATSCNTGGSTASDQSLCTPVGLAVDSSENLWVADAGNSRVLEFQNPVALGTLNAELEIGQPDFVSNSANQGGGPAINTLYAPTSVAIDSHGNLYIADLDNSRVLEYNAPLSTAAGANNVWGQSGFFNRSDCTTSATGLCYPAAVALDSSDNLYIADSENSRILKFSESSNPPSNFGANLVLGQMSTTSSGSCNQEAAISAQSLCGAGGLALDASGDLFAADSGNNRVVEYLFPLSNDESASVVLGQGDFLHNTVNSLTGASLSAPQQIAIDSSVTPHRVYIADQTNNRVLAWHDAESFVNGAQADVVIGQPDFFTSACVTAAANNFCRPQGVAVDSTGNLYVSDYSNSRVLEFSTPFSACGSFPCAVTANANLVLGQGTATSFATSGCNLNSSTVSAVTLCDPGQLALDSVGNLYVADTGNNRALEYNTPLSVTSVTGSGDVTADFVFGQGNVFTTNSYNEPAESATSLYQPVGVASDPSNNIYISDTSNYRVLEFNETTSATTAPSNSTANEVFGQGGVFTTSSCSTGANGLCSVQGLAIDTSGNLFLTDNAYTRALEFTTPLTNTTADFVWGQGGDFSSDYGCDLGGSQPSAQTLCYPAGIATDSSGSNVLIADTGNNRALLFEPPFAGSPEIVRADSVGRAGTLTVSPVALQFRKTKVKRKSGPETITVTNSGSVPVKIGALHMLGDDYSINNKCGPTLPAGVSCTLEVSFNPVTRGERGSRIVIDDSALNGPHVVSLQGRALRR